MDLAETDFNDEGLMDQETLISKISEKLEKMECMPRMRGLEIYRICMIRQMEADLGNESTGGVTETQNDSETESSGVVAETQIEPETVSSGVVAEIQIDSETESPGVVAETQIEPETESVGVVAEPQIDADFMKQLLSQLDLSEKETENSPETMDNYSIDVTS
jgi:hypothetical protein